MSDENAAYAETARLNRLLGLVHDLFYVALLSIEYLVFVVSPRMLHRVQYDHTRP